MLHQENIRNITRSSIQKSKDLNELLKIAIEASLAAGSEIMKIYRQKDFVVEEKADKSPLTIADKIANEVINNYLSPTKIPVISEENKLLPFEKRKLWKTCWVVDPLDGTKEFLKRNGEFTVNIALVEDSNPVLGVIYVPATGILYFADVNEQKSYKMEVNADFNLDSVLKDSKEINPSPDQDIIRVVGSRSHMTEETILFNQSLKESLGKEVEIVQKGSSLKFCLVAEGLADVYPRFGPTMEWDTAAGQAICEALGLQVLDLKTGKNIVYNRENPVNNPFVVSALV